MDDELSASRLSKLYLDLECDTQVIKLDSLGNPVSKESRLVKDIRSLQPYFTISDNPILRGDLIDAYKDLASNVLDSDGYVEDLSNKNLDNIKHDMDLALNYFNRFHHEKATPNPMNAQCILFMIHNSKIEYLCASILQNASKENVDLESLKADFSKLFTLCPPESKDRKIYCETLYQEPFDVVKLNIGRILVTSGVGTTYNSKATLVPDPKMSKLLCEAVSSYLDYMKKQNRKLESVNKSILLTARKLLASVYKNEDRNAPLSTRMHDIETIQKILDMVRKDYKGMFRYSSQYNDTEMITYEPPFWSIRELCSALCYDIFYNKYSHEILNEKFRLSQLLIFGCRYKRNDGTWYFSKHQPLGIDKRFA